MRFGWMMTERAISVAVLVSLAACSSVPQGSSAEAIDARYGIPPDSVPAYLLQPNGLMTNGLLPAQPYDTGG